MPLSPAAPELETIAAQNPLLYEILLQIILTQNRQIAGTIDNSHTPKIGVKAQPIGVTMSNISPAGQTPGSKSLRLPDVPNPPNSLQLYKNGVRLTSGYSVNGQTIVLTTPMSLKDAFIADYRK